MKLLIVDDEPIEREGMEAILQKAFPELTIYQAKNGKMAIELADDNSARFGLNGYYDAWHDRI